MRLNGIAPNDPVGYLITDPTGSGIRREIYSYSLIILIKHLQFRTAPSSDEWGVFLSLVEWNQMPCGVSQTL